MKTELAKYSEVINKTLSKIEKENIVDRIWKKDHTVWRKDPTEISNRLGWLDCVDVTCRSFNEISSFVDEIKAAGFTHALLMGMGGSSLAPEVFRLIFGVKEGYLDLAVLDSTHPEAVKEFSDKLDAEKTLFIVSTKSGGTIETISFMKYFYTEVVKKLGKEKAGNRFVAITDSGSGLEIMARELKFRKIFLNDPNIGGRFSALSLFGSVPAALVGVDLNELFSRAEKMVNECKQQDVAKNSGVMLGAIVGTLANEGVDKLTISSSSQLRYFGAWLEQLIAESTGKDGKGILPVDLEPDLPIDEYSLDRIFIYIKLKSDLSYDKKFSELNNAKYPTIVIELNDIYDIAEEFIRWEFATAIAGYVLNIQPFNQPDVESAKIATKETMKQYSETGKLPILNPVLTDGNIRVYGDINARNLESVLSEFLSAAVKNKSFVVLQAYLKPEEKTWQVLQNFRFNILKKYKIATILGYGPRFLHSTGQLHKGDGRNGLFIQFLADDAYDVPIPDSAGVKSTSFTFGILKNAQALGDRQALIDYQRKVIRFHLGNNIIDGLNKLANLI